MYFNDAEAVIGRRFLLNSFQNMNAGFLFINRTVTAIICNFYAYYFVNSNNIYARELAVSNRSSVLLKFLIIQQVESYIQVAHLKFQLRQRQYFQSQFTNVEYMILNMLL